MNPRVASELQRGGLLAVSIHDLGLSNQRFQDASLLTLAISRQETLLTLDADFLRIHSEYRMNERSHFGIIYGPTAKYQQSGMIGSIVRFCLLLDELIEGGAGTLQNDIYNQLIFLSEG